MAAQESSNQPVVAIVGLGYVGLPLAIGFAEAGCRVIGLDVDRAKTDRINAGESYIAEIGSHRVKELVGSNHLCATTYFAQMRQAEAIVICVPTPLTEAREPDMQYITGTARTLREFLQPGQLVVLESTTYPGTTEEVLLPILEESGLRCPRGTDSADSDKVFHLAFSPERIDPGNKKFQLREIPKVVGGANAESSARARALYEKIFDRVVEVSSTQAAEMTKLLENIYRSVNIALVNELKLICQRMGIDVWEVIEAAATKPYGFQAFYPGPGLGGHCIPIDPFYLTWKAREYDLATRFIELAGEINTSMPYHVVQAVTAALNENAKAIKNSRILLLGAAYKKDVDDMRESPAMKIMELLRERGADISYNDPHIPRLHRMRKYDFSDLQSIELTPENLSRCDCVIIVTDHSSYDFGEIVKHASLVVDTRNATRDVPDPDGKIVRC